MKPPLKILAFIILLALLHALVSILFPAPLPEEIVQFDRYLSQNVDMLYLGDSTLVLPYGEVTTGEILQELLPDQYIGPVESNSLWVGTGSDNRIEIARLRIICMNSIIRGNYPYA